MYACNLKLGVYMHNIVEDEYHFFMNCLLKDNLEAAKFCNLIKYQYVF